MCRVSFGKLSSCRRNCEKRLRISSAWGSATLSLVMHNPWNPPLMLLMRAARVPYAYVLHDASPHPGEEHRWVHGALFDLEIRLSRLFVCLSNNVRNRLVEDRGIAQDRVLVVRHGTRLAARSTLRRSTSNDSVCRLSFLGRILSYKGLDILCEAFRKLRADGLPVELEIAGEGKLPNSAVRLIGTPGVVIRNEFIPEDEIAGAYFPAQRCWSLPMSKQVKAGSSHWHLPTVYPLSALRLAALSSR